MTSRARVPRIDRLSRASFQKARHLTDAMSQSHARQHAEAYAEYVRCLSCDQAYVKPSRGSVSVTNPGCPRCGYVGWVPAIEGAARGRSDASRRLHRLY